MQLVKIKDVNIINVNKPFFDLITKAFYKLIGIDLSRQANLTIPQEINFTEKLEDVDGAAMFFICKAAFL